VLTVAPAREAAETPRRMAWPVLRPLARKSREAGPIPWLAATISQRLAAGVAAIDRIVLDGVAEGLALLGLGTGWLVAWCDRRGMDAIEHGAGHAVGLVGRLSRALVMAPPARMVLLLGLLTLVLAMLGRSG
jgi:hypothetical protein